MSATARDPHAWPQLGVAAAFLISGALHLLVPGPYRRIVPRALPRPGVLVALSGAAELVCAAGLLRRAGWAGPASAAVLVTVFPANVQMALDMAGDPAARPWQVAAAWLRLPLQVPLILAALHRPDRAGRASSPQRQLATGQVSALDGSSSTERV